MLPADLPLALASPGKAAAPDLEPRTFVFRFTGSGHEYFRIWIVNLLLSVASFGIYSAWAKVRRLQYFDRNTSLAGATFDFHGHPPTILRGRVVAVALLAAYQYAIGFSAAAALAVGAGLLLAAPFLMRGALRFRLGHTSYRALPFAFTGSVRGAYLAYLAPATLFVLPGVMIAAFGPTAWTALALLLYAAWPLLARQMKHYQYGHVRYGDLASTSKLPLRGFFGIYLQGVGLLAAGCALFAVVSMSAAFVLMPLMPDELFVNSFTNATMLAVVIIAYLLLGPYQQLRMLNLCLAGTQFPGVQFVSTLRLWPYLRFQFKNMVLTILSLGLYRPFAVVNAHRYRLEHLAVRCEGDIDAVLATASRPQGAAGDGATDFFGLDLSW